MRFSQRPQKISAMYRSCSLLAVLLQLWSVVSPLQAICNDAVNPRNPTDRGIAGFDAASNHYVSLVVLPNALADMNIDGVVDLLDLLRIRDISLGSLPSPYEITEGDLDADGAITSTDVLYLRDILLNKTGLPHVVGPGGGSIVGNNGRTTFTVPSGAFNEDKRMSVGDVSRDDFELSFGTSLSVLGPAVTYMAGARLTILNPTSDDSLLPPGVSMFEEVSDPSSVDTTGTNAVFNVTEDLDGDGIPDFRLLGDLSPNESRTQMSYHLEPELQISNLIPVRLDPVTGMESPSLTPTIEPGMFLAAYGTGWQSVLESDYEVRWVSGDQEVVLPIFRILFGPSKFREIRGVVFMVPGLGPGPAEVQIRCAPNGRVSQLLPVSVSGPTVNVQPGLKDSILAIYACIDSLLSEFANDPRGYQIASSQGFDVGQALTEFRDRVEDLVNTPEDSLNAMQLAIGVRLWQNAQGGEFFGQMQSSKKVSSSALREPPDPNYFCLGFRSTQNAFWDVGFWVMVFWMNVVVDVGCTAICGLVTGNPVFAVICGVACATALNSGFDAARDWLNDKKLRSLQGCCPPEYVVSCKIPPRNKSSNLDFEFVCIHFKWHAMLAAPYGSWSCVGDECNVRGLAYECDGRFPPTSNRPEGMENVSAVSMIRDTKDIIIRVVDSPIPWSQGSVSGSGMAYIPFNVVSGKVQLSAFDPKTGNFDDNVAEIDIDDPFGRVDVIPVSFRPDTTKIIQPIAIGEWFERSISIEIPNYEFILPVVGGDIGSHLRMQFRAENPLSFIITDPTGVQISNNSGTTNCVHELDVVVPQNGQYKLRVGRGNQGQIGRFAIGVRYVPYPAIPYLCGSVEGSLDLIQSPYICADNAIVSAGRNLQVQPGVSITFDPGGSIAASGTLQGTATPGNPIILAPHVATKPDGLSMGVKK